MNIVLMSNSKESKLLYKRFSKFPQKYTIVCVAEQDASCWGVQTYWKETIGPICCSVGRAVKFYQQNEADVFIIPSLSEPENRGMFQLLLDLGVKAQDILYAPVELIFHKNESVVPDSFLTVFMERKELETMEFHAADHCNLNCRYCSMFAGLVTEEKYPDLEQFKKDVIRIRQFFTHIKRIRIIGGEPFLNPELSEYLVFVREMYPYSFIKIITNGILVQSMPEELINVIHKYHIHVTVTYYPYLLDKIDDIADFLRSKDISYDVTPMTVRFQKIYDLEGNGDVNYNFTTCYWKSGCATLRDGKFAACFVPFVLPFASAAFSLNYEPSGLIDLYEEGLTTLKIREKLETPFDTCRYCGKRGVMEKWGIVKNTNCMDIHEWCLQ